MGLNITLEPLGIDMRNELCTTVLATQHFRKGIKTNSYRLFLKKWSDEIIERLWTSDATRRRRSHDFASVAQTFPLWVIVVFNVLVGVGGPEPY